MAQLSDLNPSANIKLLLFGDSGTGKTCFAMTFPGPIWVADFDGKISSAAAFYSNMPDVLAQVEYENYVALGKEDMPAERFNKKLGELKQLAREGKFPYRTIVIDSLTTYADETMKYLMKENPGVKRMITRLAQAPSQQDYGIANIFHKQLIGELVAFPCNIVVTAHIATEKDELTGEILRTPLIAGQLKQKLPIYFSEVHRAFTRDGKYFAQTQSDGKFQCRSQIKNIPREIPLHYHELVKQR